jgi:hypothetical protein
MKKPVWILASRLTPTTRLLNMPFRFEIAQEREQISQAPSSFNAPIYGDWRKQAIFTRRTHITIVPNLRLDCLAEGNA